MASDRQLVRRLRDGLRELADPQKAPQMQAYMKSAMPYRGVQTVARRRMQGALFSAHPLDEYESFRDTVLELWRGARFREERYAAIELAGLRAYDHFQTMKTLPVYREMITSGAWWDTVDPIATHRLRRLLQKYPGAMARQMRLWSRARDLWKRRSAILCQIGRKKETDLDLLYHCIEENLEREEFFLRKAIGWALRQYAWTDPDEVRRFVASHQDLSALSRREALKNI